MIKKIIITLLIITPLLLFYYEFSVPKGPTAPPAVVVGVWQAEAKTHVGPLKIHFNLSEDGVVEGAVGGATMHNAAFRRNRGWLGRTLHMATDYIITGKLNGPVAEDVQCAQFRIVGQFNENGIRGDFAGMECLKDGERCKPPGAGRLTFTRVEQPSN